MSDQDVSYTLSLKDLLTGKVREADGAINHMEGSLASAGKAASGFGKELVGALGVSFALFKGFEFVHEGVEAMHALEQSEAQVRAGLESTRGVAGLTMEALEKGARDAAAQFKYSRSQIMDMQSILLTFPSVTAKTFGPASQAIFDMSTRLKQDLQGTAIQVGKALQDPIHGVVALRRVGVNFNETQTEMIRKMVAGGHAAQAQAFILKELATEFGGSAKAAADADPLFKFNKLMGSLKMSVGEVALELLQKLTPALEWIATLFKETLEWCRKNADLFKALAIGVGVAAGAYVVYRGILLAGIVVQAVQTTWTYAQIAAMYVLGGAYETAGIATKLLAAAQYALNAAWTANPIGIVIAAIAALVAFVVYAYNHFAKFRAFLWATWAVIKEVGSIIVDYFVGLKDILVGTLTLDSDQVARGMDKLASSTIGAGKRLAEAAKKGWNEGMADFAKDNAGAPKKVGEGGKKGAGAADAPKAQISKPKGQTVKNITINIKELVHELRVQTTNLTEGSAKIRDLVTQAVLSAVNDSQMIGGE